jgi:hypothetical protein
VIGWTLFMNYGEILKARDFSRELMQGFAVAQSGELPGAFRRL